MIKKKLRSPLDMEEVITPPLLLFDGHDYLQHGGTGAEAVSRTTIPSVVPYTQIVAEECHSVRVLGLPDGRVHNRSGLGSSENGGNA